MNEAEIKKLLMTVGLCAKAGKLVCGTEQICDVMREGKALFLVIEASDSSANTHKRLSDRCEYYGVRLVRIQADTAVIGDAVGKHSPVAAVGVTDAGLCRAVVAKLGD